MLEATPGKISDKSCLGEIRHVDYIFGYIAAPRTLCTFCIPLSLNIIWKGLQNTDSPLTTNYGIRF